MANIHSWNGAAWVQVGSSDLDGLTDVDLTTTAPVNGDVLVWDTAALPAPGQWVPQAAPAPAPQPISWLTDADTTTTAPTARQTLIWVAPNWIPGTLLFNDLGDVDMVANPPTAGDGIIWNGTQWVPGTPDIYVWQAAPPPAPPVAPTTDFFWCEP